MSISFSIHQIYYRIHHSNLMAILSGSILAKNKRKNLRKIFSLIICVPQILTINVFHFSDEQCSKQRIYWNLTELVQVIFVKESCACRALTISLIIFTDDASLYTSIGYHRRSLQSFLCSSEHRRCMDDRLYKISSIPKIKFLNIFHFHSNDALLWNFF